MLIIAPGRVGGGGGGVEANRDMFSIFYNMKVHVCCVFSLESPYRGDSNEYTQYTIFNFLKEKKNTL